MGRLGSPIDWGKMRARRGEEDSGDGREDWWRCRAVLTCPNVRDPPGKDPP